MHVNLNIICLIHLMEVLVKYVLNAQLIVFNVIKFQQDQLQLLALSVSKGINIHLIIVCKDLYQIALLNFLHANNA